MNKVCNVLGPLQVKSLYWFQEIIVVFQLELIFNNENQ